MNGNSNQLSPDKSNPLRASSTDSSREEDTPGKKSTKKKYIFIGIAILAILLVIVFWKHFSKHFIKFIVKSIKKIAKMPEPWSSLTFIGFLLFYQFSFIPTQSMFLVLMSYALNSFLHSILLQAISTFTSASLTYYFATTCWKKCLDEKYKKELLYKVALHESKHNPYKINLIFRIMYIPVTFKNCILPLTGTNYKVYAICLIPAIFFFGTLYTLIGLGLNSVDEFFEVKRFGKMKFFEKVKVIVGYIVAICTLGMFIGIWCYTKIKMKEFKKKMENEGNTALDEKISIEVDDSEDDINNSSDSKAKHSNNNKDSCSKDDYELKELKAKI